MELKYRLLRESFGYTEFRPGQENLIDAILGGKDVLAIMPTGAGKSLCYQIPAMLLPGITFVITPSISLMHDQVAALGRIGFSACFINSTQTVSERQSVMQMISTGRVKLIYIAPERLFLPDFAQLVQHLPVSMVAVDEAHCISQWGHDFRPAYRHIPEFIYGLVERPIVAAFTATATVQVRQDIIEVLGLHQPEYLVTDFDRPNLYYQVRRAYDRELQLLRFVQKQHGACGIVYCLTRRKTEEIAQFLCDNQIPAVAYHAGLKAAERRFVQQKFLSGTVPIIVATNAFGMGIDKPDVRFVVHFGMPRDLESYYQEAGRAGRDGMPAECLLLFDEADLSFHKNLIHSQIENLSLMPEDAKWLKKSNRARLKEMKRYVFTEKCLRQHILNYFGQNAVDFCGNCSNCKAASIQQDVTTEAQKILSCIYRLKQNCDAHTVCRVLQGNTDVYTDISTYGIMRGSSTQSIMCVLNGLIRLGYLDAHLRLHTSAKQVLFHNQKVILPLPARQNKYKKFIQNIFQETK